MRALIQWVRDIVRTKKDPATALLQIYGDNFPNIIRTITNREQWINKSNGKGKTAKLKKPKYTTRWVDQRYFFFNLIHTQPGRNGVPLSYIIRDNYALVKIFNTQLIDNYFDQTPNIREAFALYAAEVHTYIVNCITENSTA